MRRSDQRALRRLERASCLPIAVAALSGCQADVQVLETVGTTTDAAGGGDAGGERVLRAQSLSAGQFHTCTTRNGTLDCWGENRGGPLGTGDEVPRAAPTRVGEDLDWIEVAAGDRVTCGRRIDGSVWCWGENVAGEASDPSLLPVLEPIRVDLPLEASRIVTKFKTVCALLEDRSVWCWGEDFEGQLGQSDPFDPNGQPTPVPVQLPLGNEWQSIDTGQGHTCGIRASGELWCWGRNVLGEVGIGPGTEQQVRTPMRVGNDADWIQVSAGQSTTCGIRVDGTLWCWGVNDDGQLTFPDPDPVRVPTLVEGLAGWSQISVNTFGACGIRSGSIWCWGRNDEGQLGTGDNVDRREPVRIGTGSDWVTVSSGRFHVCARRADDTVWCTGENAEGKPLGVGDYDRRNELTPIVTPGADGPVR